MDNTNAALEKRIRDRIAQIEKDFKHVLTGSVATIFENAPRVLEQSAVEATLRELYALLGERYVSKLKRQGG